MTLKKDESLLQQGAAQPQGNSIFDFLYQDARRIGSYLAQLTPAGHVNGIKLTKSTHKGEASSVTMSGGTDVKVLHASRDKAEQTNTTTSDVLESSVDPLWGNAIDLLNILAARGMIVRDPNQARIGQFVLVEGRLNIFNLQQLNMIWNNPKLLGMIQAGIAGAMQASGDFDGYVESAIKQNGKTTSRKDYSELAKQIVGTIKDLPASIQGRITSPLCGATFSFCLQEDSLTTTALDLFLKHGTAIQGEWAVLGILDAEPDSYAGAPPKEESPFFSLLNGLSGMARHVGRPPDAYGISPLLVFRGIG